MKADCLLGSIFLALILGLPRSSHAENTKMNLPPGMETARAGGVTLHDPDSLSHPRLDLGGRVGVVIFSVPDMSQGPSQRRWSAFLADKPESRVSDKIALVLVENMAEAGPFKEEARSNMKEKFALKKRPFLLLDETGATCQRFGILRDRTEILIFDKTGALRDVEQDLSDKDQTIARVKAITAQLLGSHP